MLGDEQFGRILHFPKAGSGHFEYRQLACGTEAVLDAAENAIGPAVFSFELQHHVHYVLKNLGPGYGAFLCYVTNQYHWHAASFGISEQGGGNFPDLAHGAGGAVHGGAVHRLHRIQKKLV